MIILFVNPYDRGEDVPTIPYDIGRLASIADSSGHKLDVMDLNAYREMNTNEAILDGLKYEKAMVDYDLIWIVASFRTLAEAKRLAALFREKMPEAVIAIAGSAPTAMPIEVFKLVKDLDLAVFGDQEETFLEVLDRVSGQRWEPVKGVAYATNMHGGVRRNAPRPPIAELDGLPFPKYRFIPMKRYFDFSPLPFCLESRRRVTFSWERRDGQTVRFPSPKRAVENISVARFRYAMDFAMVVDPGIMTGGGPDWFKAFVGAYQDEGLNEIAPWSCWADPAYLMLNPDVVRLMKDAGCRTVAMEISSTTDERKETQRKFVVEALKRANIAILPRYVVGAPGQSFDDIAGMTYLSLVNKNDPYEVVQPNLYPDGPYYDQHKEEILAPFGDLATFVADDSKNSPVSWKGSFDFADVVALRTMVRTNDFKSLLRFAHMRSWSHGEKFVPHCPVCQSVAVEGRAVAKAAMALNRTVGESRVPTSARGAL